MSRDQCVFKGQQAGQEEGKRFSVSSESGRRPARRVGAVAFVVLLLGVVMVLLPTPVKANAGAGAQVSVGVSVNFGPPPLPVYEQPMCPGPGYIWTPGYWAWDPGYGYYWVPGTWVEAPFRGALWTPGYWGWDPGVSLFMWHRGYWGLSVGFYGGIDYGFGYFGRGYDGGYWRGGDFFYNRAVNRVNIRYITHVYDRDEFHHEGGDRISYNGGRGGIDARPTREDFRAERERRMGPVGGQDRQERMARGMPGSRWSVNHGRPDVAATPRPERFMDRGAVRATGSGGPYRAEQPRGQARPQGGGWHAFGEQPARGRQPNYGGAPRQYNQQRANADRQQTRQDQGQRAYRGPQGRGDSQRPTENRQQNTRQQENRRGGPAPRQGGNENRQNNVKGERGKPGNPHGRGRR